MKFVPHNYQKKACKFIIKNPHCGLFIDMGLGKTAITLSAVNYLLKTGEIHKVLVIAPKMVAETTWTDEGKKWDHLSWLKINAVTGDKKKRAAALSDSADVYVIGRDNVTWLIEEKLYKDFDMLIIDELSSFKNSQSKRFRALKKIRGQFKRIVGLTGTPASNGLQDLWAQMYLIDGGERLLPTITGYRCNWFRPGASRGRVVFNWIPLKGSEEEIYEKISDICLSMKAEDYLELPERIDRTVKIRLSEKEMSLYSEMAKERVLELEEGEVTAQNAAAVMNKLLQMSNGCVYSEDGEIKIHSKKVEKLKEIVDVSTEPILVFYSFKHDLEAIKEAIPQAVLFSGADDLRAWNEGKIKVLLAHPASCGYGLNMAAGGHVVIWFGLTWSLEQYQQANARLYRQGQNRPVIIHHLITEGTVDEKVMAALKNKDVSQAALLDALKIQISSF